jgi:glycosyltransferase involved in cell wall biosynthesis
MAELGVVLISKNQEWNIGRLVESVLTETSAVLRTEIVLVDSASTDRTADIACSYPVGVLCLWPDQHLTPAAGRYIGYKNTTADLILFLDGDMALYPGWVEKAFRVFRTHPRVAVVTGELIDLPKMASSAPPPPLTDSGMDLLTEIPYGGGAAMYRRSVLERVGSFNPYLYSDEEPELCIRIRQAQYRIMKLSHPIAYHYSDPAGKLSTLVGRWRRKLYLGAGQNLRYHLGSHMFWPYLRERGYGIIPGLGLVVGLFCLLWSIVACNAIWLGIWITLFGAVIVGDALRRRDLRRTVASLLERLLIVDGTIRGFLLKPLDPDQYPDSLEVIQWMDSNKVGLQDQIG